MLKFPQFCSKDLITKQIKKLIIPKFIKFCMTDCKQEINLISQLIPMNCLLVSRGLGATAQHAVFLLGPVGDVAGDVLHGADVDELSLLPVPLLVVVDEGVHLAVYVQNGDCISTNSQSNFNSVSVSVAKDFIAGPLEVIPT